MNGVNAKFSIEEKVEQYRATSLLQRPGHLANVRKMHSCKWLVTQKSMLIQ
jgi:hypothetical protein